MVRWAGQVPLDSCAARPAASTHLSPRRRFEERPWPRSRAGSKRAKRYEQLRAAFQSRAIRRPGSGARDARRGADLALATRASVRLSRGLASRDSARAPPRLTETPKCRGSTGRRCPSPTARDLLREEPASITKKVRTMQTDPARVHRPIRHAGKVPVWSLHKIFPIRRGRPGCRRLHDRRHRLSRMQAPVIDAIIAEQEPIKERAQKYLDDPSLVPRSSRRLRRARKLAEETMRDVRK